MVRKGPRRPALPRPSPVQLDLEIELRQIEPRIWRRVRVRSDLTLPQLHEVLQVVMGWEDCHLHVFVTEAGNYSNVDPAGEPGLACEAEVRLDQVMTRTDSTLRYDYDMGDSWEHSVTVRGESELPADAPGALLLGGENACPPEDSGGAWRYMELKAILANPKHPEHEEMSQLVEPGFDPARFDLADVQARLAELLLEWRG